MKRITDRYGAVTQALHWCRVILVLVAFIFGPGGSEQRIYAAARDFDRQLHETLGLSVLLLTVLSVLWRFAANRPTPAPGPRWMGIAAKAVQAGLYVLLFAVPFTAIGGAWLEGHPLTLLSRIEIAPPIAKAHDLGAALASIHGWLGDAILWLAGLHAAAALYHHYALKDGVLDSMLPNWMHLPR
jgi:cytochrome b561